MTRPQSAAMAKPDYVHGKQLAEQIFSETMAAIGVRHVMHAKLKYDSGALIAGELELPLARPPRVVAFGKAANRMAAVLDEILGGRIEAGVSVAPAKRRGGSPTSNTLLAAIPTPTPPAWKAQRPHSKLSPIGPAKTR